MSSLPNTTLEEDSDVVRSFEWFVLSQFLAFTSFLGITAIAIHTCVVTWKTLRRTNTDGEQSFRLLFILSLASYFFFNIFSFYQAVFGTSVFRDYTHEECVDEYYFFQIWAYGLGKYFMYNLFVARLYTSFKGSTYYAYKPWVIKTLIGVTQLYVLVVGIPFSIAVEPRRVATTNSNYFTCSNVADTGSADIALGGAVLFDFCFSIAFLILFTRKLNSLRSIQFTFLIEFSQRQPSMKSRSASPRPKPMSSMNSNEGRAHAVVDLYSGASAGEKETKKLSSAHLDVALETTAPIDGQRLRAVNQLSEVIRKQTILVCTAVGSTALLLFLMVADMDLSALSYIDPLVNSICVWLLLRSNAAIFEMFDKLCCVVCTRHCCGGPFCEKCCACNDAIAKRTDEMEKSLLSRQLSKKEGSVPRTKSKDSSNHETIDDAISEPPTMKDSRLADSL